MRNLVICCDGTWADRDRLEDTELNPTNVARIYNAADAGRNEKYYHPGVGTSGGFWARFRGGLVGDGLDKNIISAYVWLVKNYKENDNIFIFGYSRGAYTARCLAGMISRCGLLDVSAVKIDIWKAARMVYGIGYRKRHKHFPPCLALRTVKVKFLGVWDTVGSLGIPDNFIILSFLFNRHRKYVFTDRKLGKNIENARHALALDEQRASFTPTLWDDTINTKKKNSDECAEAEPPARDPRIKRRWFVGGHGDVGGGCRKKGLSDIALKWMMDEARACGLNFRQNMYDQLKPDYQCYAHNYLGGTEKLMRTQPRYCPYVDAHSPEIHDSVKERQKNPPIRLDTYRANESFSALTQRTGNITVYAKDAWTYTGIYLEQGKTYNFFAHGNWQLKDRVKCGPDENQKVRFMFIRFILGDISGFFEKFFRLFSGNKYGDALLSKRVEEFPWLILCGAVMLRESPNVNGMPTRPLYIKIGKERLLYKAETSGYLYCFVNDTWGFDDQRQGSLTLMVERI